MYCYCTCIHHTHVKCTTGPIAKLQNAILDMQRSLSLDVVRVRHALTGSTLKTLRDRSMTTVLRRRPAKYVHKERGAVLESRAQYPIDGCDHSDLQLGT